MKKINVKEEFKKDFEENFYQFDGMQTLQNIKEEIAHQNIPFRDTIEQSKRNALLVYGNIFGIAIFIFLMFLLTNIIENNSKKYVDIADYFEIADVEYVNDPILVCSSYLGEELRIYEALKKGNLENEVEYYYFYNQTIATDVSHLLFINNDKDIFKTMSIENKFGNLSELLKISKADNIEIIIVYGDEEVYSQFFIAK